MFATAINRYQIELLGDTVYYHNFRQIECNSYINLLGEKKTKLVSKNSCIKLHAYFNVNNFICYNAHFVVQFCFRCFGLFCICNCLSCVALVLYVRVVFVFLINCVVNTCMQNVKNLVK